MYRKVENMLHHANLGKCIGLTSKRTILTRKHVIWGCHKAWKSVQQRLKNTGHWTVSM